MPIKDSAIIKNEFPHLEPLLMQEIIGKGTIKCFNSGEESLRTGQFIRYTVLIVRGLVKVYREDDEGNEFLMYYLEEGNACALSMVCTSKNEHSKVLGAITETYTNRHFNNSSDVLL